MGPPTKSVLFSDLGSLDPEHVRTHGGFILEGCFRLLLLFDVAEGIDLKALSGSLSTGGRPEGAPFKESATPYVRFRDPPVVQRLEDLVTSNGDRLKISARYYSFGVVVLQLEVPFKDDWFSLARTADWIERVPKTHGKQLAHLLEVVLQRINSLTHRPTANRLEEKYLIINVANVQDSSGKRIHPGRLKDACGQEIAKLLRNAERPLAEEELEEIFEGSLSYYQNDLAVVTSSAAFIQDRPDEAGTESFILEFAKIQLLEFRYYDALLGNVLDDIYRALERKRNIVFARWTLPRDAKRFNRIRVDTIELRERVDSAIKFFSDVFYARLYRLAADRMGVPQYRQAVDDRLHTIGELYEFMVDQFNEARTFVLELIVAVLALLDVLFLLRGK